MSAQNHSSLDDLFTMAFAGLLPRISQLHIQIATLSGREFKYEVSEYPIEPTTTPDSALAQAQRIFRDKYRWSEWDQRHPNVNVEQEIVTGLVEHILCQAEKIRRWQERNPSTSLPVSLPGNPTIEVFPSPRVELLALKAMRVGREADLSGHQSLVKTFIGSCLANLDKRPTSPGVRGWKQFYLLVLAELFRFSDPMRYREEASELGEDTWGDRTNLFPWYMKMVRATDRAPTSGNFGDFKAAPRSKFDNSGYVTNRGGHAVRVGATAEEALGLREWELARHSGFLETGLYTIAHRQGLVE